MNNLFAPGSSGGGLRARALLAASVVPADQVPGIVSRLGERLEWPELIVGKGDIGYVYFARSRATGVFKIGFSTEILRRMQSLRMAPVALVRFTQIRHERALQSMLRDECLTNELFSGPRTIALVTELRRVGVTKFGELDARCLGLPDGIVRTQPAARVFSVASEPRTPADSHARVTIPFLRETNWSVA